MKEYDNQNQIKREIQDVWGFGPRAWSDSLHPDPLCCSGRSIVADTNFALKSKLLNIHPDMMTSCYYPWSKPGASKGSFQLLIGEERYLFHPFDVHHWNELSSSCVLNSIMKSRVMEVCDVYEKNKTLEDPAYLSSSLYVQFLDKLFGLEELTEIGIDALVLHKKTYPMTELPQTFGKTLLIGEQIGIPVSELLYSISKDAMYYKAKNGDYGFKVSKKGDFIQVDSRGRKFSDSSRYCVEDLTSLVDDGNIVPVSYAIDVAQAIANSYGEVPVYHFGNSYGGIFKTEKSWRICMDYGLHQMQMYGEYKDQFPLVKSRNHELNLPNLYILFGKLRTELLTDTYRRQSPMTVEQLSYYQCNW